MYISEIAPTSLRGSLGVVNQLSITVGVLVVLSLGLLFEPTDHWWRLLNFLSLAPSGALVLAALFGPETPRWLISQGRREEACTSMSLFPSLSLCEHASLRFNSDRRGDLICNHVN
jgi:MFS family permease